MSQVFYDYKDKRQVCSKYDLETLESTLYYDHRFTCL